jgi:predicted GNAT family acetyltransferase
MDTKVTNNRLARRFEICVANALAVLDYEMEDGTLILLHTGVPAALEGQGIGGKLVKAALEEARAQGLKIDPQCSFVRGYIERHPEYASFLA